ncbi:MAG: hypothetical protein ACHQ53_01485 [Polyangiales bacterium]
MSAVSIIPSLFFPDVGPRPRAPSLARCASELSALDQALVEITARSLRGKKLSDFGRSLHAWDTRATALSGGCGPLDEARKDLLHLRADVEALIRKIDSGPRKTQERIRRALQQIKERAAAAQSQS